MIMPESTTSTTNDQIKLTKLHTNPKKGYKLGSASATWKKIKSATSTGNLKSSSSTNNVNANVAPSITSSGSEDAVDEELLDDLSLAGGPSTLIEYGSSGQLLILYPELNVLEVWDWKSIDHQPNLKIMDTDTLHLNHKVTLSSGNGVQLKPIKFFKIIHQQASSYHIITVGKQEENHCLQLHSVSLYSASTTIIQSIELPTVFGTPTSVKTSNKFIIIGDNEGLLLIYRFDADNKHILSGNLNSCLYGIKKSSCQPILSKLNIINKFPNDEILLQTSLSSDGVAIFDIIDNWLVYSPSTFEYKHLLAIGNNSSGSTSSTTTSNVSNNSTNASTDTFIINDATYDELDPIITNFNTNSNNNLNLSLNLHDSTGFTPVKLPASGPLLNKVLSSLSNSALDGLFKLSELSSMKVKSLINTTNEAASITSTSTSTTNTIETPTINSIGKSIGKLLYSTASTTAQTLSNSVKKSWEDGYNNRLVKILDLSNDKVLGIFKPPGGVSRLSLSPYDLQLISVNLRGDSLYMWDLYRLLYEISLIGKFQRGKTSAVISEIFWFMNNNYNKDDLIYGNNSGFGCINKNSGSIHWFNINYLSGTSNNNHNYPNSLKMKKKKKKRSGGVSSNGIGKTNIKGENLSTSTAGSSGQFLDSWILSSFKAKRFIPLPNIANNELGYYVNQLAVLSKDNELKLISPLNGNHVFKYELPIQPVSANSIPIKTKEEKQEESKEVSVSQSLVRSVNPLSQAEIETCAPFLNLINNKNVEFAIYDFHDNNNNEPHNDNNEKFYEHFKEFGNEIPQRVIPIKRNMGYNNHKIKMNPSGSSVSSTGTASPVTSAGGDEALLNLLIDPESIEGS